MVVFDTSSTEMKAEYSMLGRIREEFKDAETFVAEYAYRGHAGNYHLLTSDGKATKCGMSGMSIRFMDKTSDKSRVGSRSLCGSCAGKNAETFEASKRQGICDTCGRKRWWFENKRGEISGQICGYGYTLEKAKKAHETGIPADFCRGMVHNPFIKNAETFEAPNGNCDRVWDCKNCERCKSHCECGTDRIMRRSNMRKMYGKTFSRQDTLCGYGAETFASDWWSMWRGNFQNSYDQAEAIDAIGECVRADGRGDMRLHEAMKAIQTIVNRTYGIGEPVGGEDVRFEDFGAETFDAEKSGYGMICNCGNTSGWIVRSFTGQDQPPEGFFNTVYHIECPSCREYVITYQRNDSPKSPFKKNAETFNAQYDFDKSFDPKGDEHKCWYDDHQWVCYDIDARNDNSTFDITLMCEECGMKVDVSGAVGNLTKKGKGAETFGAEEKYCPCGNEFEYFGNVSCDNCFDEYCTHCFEEGHDKENDEFLCSKCEAENFGAESKKTKYGMIAAGVITAFALLPEIKKRF